MKTILFLLIMLPVIINGQHEIGTHFQDSLSWQQIKEKAREENKHIFMDCYATWCGPCYFMADSIFTRKEVGDFLNKRFICVKVQADSSKRDNDHVKKWYRDARILRDRYKLDVFPTYFFFAPNGKIVHRDAGVKSIKEIIAAAESALDSGQQYYTLLERYKRSQLPYQQIPALANKVKELGDNTLALGIAKNYMHNYLDGLSDAEFCTKENLEFMASFYNMLSSDDRVFRLYYHQPEKVDSIMGAKNHAKEFAEFIITKEEITPPVTKAKKKNVSPDWRMLTGKIQGKYDAGLAERIVTKAKVSWYREQQDWKNYTKYLVQRIESSDIRLLPSSVGSIMFLNNSAWDIFQYSNDKQELEKAVSWMDVAIPMEQKSPAGMMDTQANLLYKLGRKEEAIALQQKAVAMEPDNEAIVLTLRKMTKGEPTWDHYK